VHRRTAAIAALVAVFTLVFPTAVLAADAILRAPTDGVVTGPTDLEVRLTREPFEAITAADAGLRQDGKPLDGSRAVPLCDGWRSCPNSESSSDHRIAFDPRTGAPFLPEDAARMLPNGPYELRVTMTVNNAPEPRSLEVMLSVPPSAATDVQASAERGAVSLRWTRAPEPDVTGYRVERRTGNDGWTGVGDVSASASSFADEPGAGTHRYRLVTLRPRGDGGTYEVTSSEATVAVDAASTGADGGDREEDGAATEGEADDAPRSDEDDEEGGSDGREAATASAPSSRSAGERSARSGLPAPSFQRGTARTPGKPGDGDDPDFFEETLRYDGDAIAADRPDRGDDRDGDRGEVLLSVPGMGSLSGALDDQQAAVPIAGGLLLTAIGLHLWRWLKLPVT
jgi:hypothetical protein